MGRNKKKTRKLEEKKKSFLDYIYKGVEIASDAADILVHVPAKPRLVDAASIGLKVLNSYKRHSVEEEKNKVHLLYFHEHDWLYCDISGFRTFVYRLTMAGNFNQKYMRGTDEDSKEKEVIIDLYGTKIGWHIRDTTLTGPWCEPGKRDEAIYAIGRAIWECLDTGACELISRRDKYTYDHESSYKADNLQDNVYESNAAKEILNRTQAFVKAGYNRSVMIYGPPGSGKSCAMRYVARELGKHTLRINVSELDSMYSKDIVLAVDMLQPDVLLVDDFDRLFKPDKLLTNLERFNTSVKVLMASVNDMDRLDKAVIRPGRFDDIIKLTIIDRSIQDRLIGDGVPKNVAAKLRKMPVAFIEDFHKRREVLGLEQAIAGVEDLQDRVVELVSGKKRRKKSKKKATKKRKTPKKMSIKGLAKLIVEEGSDAPCDPS